MSAQFSFDPRISGINIEQLLSLHFDLTKGAPVVKKLEEVLSAKQKQPDADFGAIISQVTEANKCQTAEYKRRGKRKWLRGLLYEAEPEERVSISIRGHFSSLTPTR